jgi:TolA-binding protein
MKTNLLAVTLALLAATALTSAANAQETTGAPGSPSATTTIPGNQLPPRRRSSRARSSATPRNQLPGGQHAWCRRRARQTSS